MTTHTVDPPLVGRQLHSQPPRGSPSRPSSDDGLVMAGTLALPAGNGPTAAASVTRRGTGGRQGSSSIARTSPRCCAHWRPGPRWAPWGAGVRSEPCGVQRALAVADRPARLPRTDQRRRLHGVGGAAGQGRDPVAGPAGAKAAGSYSTGVVWQGGVAGDLPRHSAWSGHHSVT